LTERKSRFVSKVLLGQTFAHSNLLQVLPKANELVLQCPGFDHEDALALRDFGPKYMNIR
jgi:hypothetical protein